MFGFEIKQMFFDREAVISRVDVASRKVLSRFGSFVRQSARSSIRKRKASAPPGSPPTNRTGLLKKFIFFGYDPASSSVVIGPARLNGRGSAPSLLEYGGSTTVVRRGRRERASYEARPYMRPAFDRERPKLPAMWSGSIKT